MGKSRQKTELVGLYMGALVSRSEYLHHVYRISLVTGDPLIAIDRRIDDAIRSAGPMEKTAAQLATVKGGS